MEKKVTITLSADEYQRVVRAVKARASYWRTPDVITRHEDAFAIAKTYSQLAAAIEEQVEGDKA